MKSLYTLDPKRFETTVVLKALASASRQLAELKGVASSIPHQGILINTLALQEAKDSSAIENIVTTHDELFKHAAFAGDQASAASKEVARYGQALRVGFEEVARRGLLTNNHITRVQSVLEQNDAGFRKVPGTTLKDGMGATIYTPPQDPTEILALMADLERFINDDVAYAVDPLIKMAMIHHQFESIHPFYDGNGRTGRILCVLYLVKQGLLDIPVLYMSRHIVRTKVEYYQRLQDVRLHDAWESWVVYMLTAVEQTAKQGITVIEAIKGTLLDVKHRVRAQHPRFYSQDLINNLFTHPYTKIEFVMHDLGVTRLTATRYLNALVDSGILTARKVGRFKYFVNEPLCAILTGDALTTLDRA
jgi:Fic family protein